MKMISFFISLSFLNVITAIPVAVPAAFPGGKLQLYSCVATIKLSPSIFFYVQKLRKFKNV